MKYRLTSGTMRENVGGITVLTTEAGDAAVFNASASAILLELLECNSRDEAIFQLLQTYDADQLEIDPAVDDVINQLVNRGMLEIVC